MNLITTFEQAYQFVLEQRICTVFGSKDSAYESLWDNTDLSEEKPSEGGWSPRVKAVWDWKTRIPQTYPDQVFYGKLKNGDAALIEMNYFREVHFPGNYVSFENLEELPRKVYGMIQLEPGYTGTLRKRAISELGCTKSQFDTALKKLQISLNVIRCNDPKFTNDFWIVMRDAHLELIQANE